MYSPLHHSWAPPHLPAGSPKSRALCVTVCVSLVKCHQNLLSCLPRKPALVAHPHKPLSPTSLPGPDLRQVWPELQGRGAAAEQWDREVGRVTHSNGDGADDSSQVALDELGRRRRLEGRDRFLGPLGPQSCHTPPLQTAPASKRQSCPPTGEKEKIPLEAKGSQASLSTAPYRKYRAGMSREMPKGPTALLPCSRELRGRHCWLEVDNSKGQCGSCTSGASISSGGRMRAGSGLRAAGGLSR